MPSADRSDATLIAELNDLIQLDHDAVEGYTIAIDRLRDTARRETLVQFRADHKRHIEELAAFVRARGGVPVELPHPTGAIKLALQALGALGNDVSILLAFKAVEGQVRDKYRRAAGRPYAAEVADVVKRAADDEDRHYRWVEDTLRELGAGSGTLPHGLAGAVETVHKIIADPLEAVTRHVMRDLGAVFGTARAKGERPHGERPVRADAARFVAALRAVEERDDVDGMVALFADDAEIANPMHVTPLIGTEGARRFWRAYRDTFEQIRSDFSRVAESGGTATLEWTSRGTLRDGRPIDYGGVTVLELRDGRIRRFTSYFDARPFEVELPRAG